MRGLRLKRPIGDSLPHQRSRNPRRTASQGVGLATGAASGLDPVTEPLVAMACDPWTTVFYLTTPQIDRIFGHDRKAICIVEYSQDQEKWTRLSSSQITVRAGATYIQTGVEDCWIRIRLAPAGNDRICLVTTAVRIPRAEPGIGIPHRMAMTDVRHSPPKRAVMQPRIVRLVPWRHWINSGEFIRDRYISEGPLSLVGGGARSGAGRSGGNRSA